MFEEKENSKTTNFWISYADLMAGLLFVFILLIGAILAKSIVLKSDLSSKEQNLQKTKEQLNKNKEALDSTKNLLNLKNQEIKKLKQMLLKEKTYVSNLTNKIKILELDLKKTKVAKAQKEKILKDYKNKIIILSNKLRDANSTIKLKNEEILTLLTKLQSKENKYEELLADLQKTKKSIKNLTGIKVKIIGILKEALGDRVKIDKSGTLRISSKVLFDKDKSELKDEAKKELKDLFTRYIKTLVVDPRIKPHLDKIIIEGHTDSDGGYLYNLNLSQARAYSVMNFLLSLDFAKELDIKKYILASGRSYLDPILDENGKEDKDASRRIEIKFLLKNDQAMKEIERILDAK